MYGPVPPDGVAVALPLHVALHVISLWLIATPSGGGSVIEKVRVVVHPFASVTVAVYVAAASEVAVAAVPPLGAQANVYGDVPPVGATVADPFDRPLHETFVCEPVVASGAGSVIVKVCVIEHPVESVTVAV